MHYHEAMSLVQDILERLDVSPRVDQDILTWRELRRLAADGLCLGAHTRSHPILSCISLDQARQEIIGSQQDLCREIGQTWPVFAYPFGYRGSLCPELFPVLKDAGFEAAMTLLSGHNVLGRTHPLCLNRVGMALHLSMAEFRLSLTRAYDVYGLLSNCFAAKAWGKEPDILRDRGI
jgi:peptidoglycan/xylan/chitin deacetylase (PgdA/CDA1 family)